MRIGLNKTLFFLLLFSVFFEVESQIKYNYDCALLKKLFEIEYTKEMLQLEKNNKSPIILIDTSNFFNHCLLPNIFNRQVFFVSDSVVERQNRHSNFLIYEMYCHKKIYSIGLFYKLTGAAVRFKFKKKNGKYILFKNESGFF